MILVVVEFFYCLVEMLVKNFQFKELVGKFKMWLVGFKWWVWLGVISFLVCVVLVGLVLLEKVLVKIVL